MYKYVTYKVTGISPILMNSDKMMNEADLTPVLTKGRKKPIPPPEVEAENKTYRLPNTNLYANCTQFKASILEGAVNFKLSNMAASKIFKGNLFPAVDICPLYKPDTDENINNYNIFICRAVVQDQGIRRARPQIDRWQCFVTFEYDEQFLEIPAITRFFEAAGRTQGIMDWRPNRRGSKGRYFPEVWDQPTPSAVMDMQTKGTNLLYEDIIPPPPALNLDWIYRNRVEEEETVPESTLDQMLNLFKGLKKDEKKQLIEALAAA
jgi:hypothetical protein